MPAEGNIIVKIILNNYSYPRQGESGSLNMVLVIISVVIVIAVIEVSSIPSRG